MLRWRPTALAAAGAGLLIAAMTMPTVAAGPSTYQQVNLVSDVPGLAKLTDPHLVNPWGMSFGAGARARRCGSRIRAPE